MRLFGSVYYKGTRYAGWQRQPNVLSVQEVIETNLSKFFNREITIYGAGRTDAGVHAFAQKFHFDVDVDHIDYYKSARDSYLGKRLKGYPDIDSLDFSLEFSISSSAKSGPQNIFYSDNINVEINNGNTFQPGSWYTVNGDPHDPGNWKYTGEH